MSALLCRHGATTADVDHMHRLQRQVEQLKSENQQLEAKVSKLSKLKVREREERGGGGGGGLSLEGFRG